MHYEGVSEVGYGSNTDPMRPSALSRSFWSWIRAGCDDTLSVQARYAAGSAWRAGVLQFIDDHQVNVIHINHAFEMLLGARLRDLVFQRSGIRSQIFCDTHDIQAKTYMTREQRNPFGGVKDKFCNLLASELSLYKDADMLIHCSRSDAAFFSDRLPTMRHKYVPPSLNPKLERSITESTTSRQDNYFDFLYLGNNNFANFLTVKWLLREVLGYFEKPVPRIAIIGNVEEMFRRYDKDTYSKFRHYFIGRVPDVGIYYSLSNAVLVPSIAGTGCSMKVIEGLCAGKTLIGTEDSLRGLSGEIKTKCQHLFKRMLTLLPRQ